MITKEVEPMFVQTARFGEVEIEDTAIINFVGPIFGFTEMTRYFLVHSSEESPFEFMQSVEDPNLTFVLTDPFQFHPEYEFDIEERWLDKLELLSEELVDIRVITTIRSATDITINLKAPIVINKQTKEGAQIILESSEYTTRYSLVNPHGEGGA